MGSDRSCSGSEIGARTASEVSGGASPTGDGEGVEVLLGLSADQGSLAGGEVAVVRVQALLRQPAEMAPALEGHADPPGVDVGSAESIEREAGGHWDTGGMGVVKGMPAKGATGPLP